MEAALFQDLGNSPATFDASRWADYYECLPGNDVQMADAIQAYIQAKLSGVPCWVELPDEAWHPSANKHNYRRPVCRLVKALYGHPDAGTMWEQHCHTAVQKVGFKPIGDEWPSLYLHPDLKLLLVIYVDDLKMAGPTAILPKGWNMLCQELRLEEETPLGLHLGCRISKGEATLHDKTKVQTVTYDMETYLEMTVKKYCDVTGFDSTKFKTVPSPSPAEETKHHPARAPAQHGKSHRCTWCGHTMPVDADGRLIPPPPIPKAPEEEEVSEANRGSLAPQAASILMKLLYAARICRFDLLRSINNLARKITKWTKKEDALLHHLIAYVRQSKHHMMIGWVGNSLETSSIGLFADANYAGCGESLKSTSGAHMHIQGPHTRFPLAGLSKRQGCLSHSTPEAEIVAADFAMSRLGRPLFFGSSWGGGGSDPNFVFYDDNQTMIGVIRAGKNPTMRHLERTHGISIGWMHSIFQEGYVSLAYEVTAKMAADIHTKSFKDSVSWTHACQLINIFPPALIGSQVIMDLMRPTHSQSADRRAINTTRSRARSLASLILRRLYCHRCCVGPVYPARLVCKNMTAWTPYWLSSSRACCGGRLQRCRRVVTFGRPGFSVKGSGIKWRIKRTFLTPQPSLIATWSVLCFSIIPFEVSFHVLPCRRPHAPGPPPLGQCFVRALPAKWQSVVAALARAIHGGYQGFTLPLRFNGRPYRTRISYAGASVIEDMWEHMANGKHR